MRSTREHFHAAIGDLKVHRASLVTSGARSTTILAPLSSAREPLVRSRLRMPGIYLAAILTTAIAVAVFGRFIHKLRLPANERLLWLAAALVLPLQPLVFFYVRVPLDQWLVAHLGSTSTAYRWLVTFYAPLTEEAAKLVPLLIPAICRDIRRENFVRYALAIGVGFAIGEMWFVAERLARIPAFAGTPFYQFGGYLSERLMVYVFHTAFTSVALWQLRRRFVLGFCAAVTLHWLANFPLSLMAWNVGGWGKSFWMVAVQCWLVVYFVGAMLLLSYLGFRRVNFATTFYGIRKCPECERNYDAPLFGVNFGRTRYERCPHCRHWHWTKTKMPDADADRVKE
jgi:hypothetical protein